MKNLHNSLIYDYQQINHQSINQSQQQNSINLNNQQRNSSGGEESLSILNTPDSGIIHSINSLSDSSNEMANLNNLEETEIDNQSKNLIKDTALPNQLNNDPFNHIIKNCKLTLEDMDNDDKVHFDFLTASQLQKIIDYYKGRFKEQHSFKSNHSLSSIDNSFNNLNNTNQLNISINSSSTSNQKQQQQPIASCFGCSLSQIEKLTGGLVLPTFIEFMILYLMKNGVSSVGVFRKSGVRSRINTLRKYCDSFFTLNHNALISNTISLTSNDSFLSINPLMQDALSKQQKNQQQSQQKSFYTLADLDGLFTEFSVYDIADTIKTWLREIKPRPLISKEVITSFKDYSNGLNNKERFCFDLVSLMNDTERYVLLIVLNMLSWFAVNSSLNQMNSHNLAICFAPSLCEIANMKTSTLQSNNTQSTSKSNQLNQSQSNQSPLRSTNPLNIDLINIPSSVPNRLLSNSPNITDLKMSSSSADSIYANENECLVDAQKCLQYLIENCSSLQMFSINSLPFKLNVTNSTNSIEGYDNNNGSVYFLNEGNLLPQTYESNPIIVQACPMDILERLLYERNLIDPQIIEWEIEDGSDIVNANEQQQHDIFIMKKQCSMFLPVKTFTLKRSWSFFDPLENSNSPSVNKKNSTIKENKSTSKNKQSKYEKFTQQGINLREEGFLYQSSYRIVTNGEGKSLVTQSLAYDLRGHSFHWYQNVFPTIIEYQLNMLKNCFQVDYLNLKNIKSSNV